MAQSTRPCMTCGATVYRTGPNATVRSWCSPECRLEQRRRKRHSVQPIMLSVPCITCQVPIPRTGRAGRIKRYCSDECLPRCVIDTCNDPQDGGRGWCNAHYKRWRATGDPLTPLTRAAGTPNAGLTCGIDDCEEPRRKREWCQDHYAAWRTHGDPKAPVKRWAERTEDCVLCGAPTAHGLRRHCSQSCWAAESRARANGMDAPPTTIPCQACGTPIDVSRRDGRAVGRLNTLACSPCFRQYRKHGVSARKLADEFGTACGICGEDVDLSLRYPDLMRASIDHKVPVARGGTNDPTNLQLVHLRCNCRKGARYSQ